MLDAGRDDGDAGPGDAVEVDQLGDLGRARGQHGIGARHDRGLGLGPGLGLGVPVERLDPGEGVEGRHERDVEGVLQPVPGDAGEPVVGVEHVDAAVGLDGALHRVGPLVEDRRQVLLGQPRVPGRHVTDADTRLDHDLGGRPVVGGPHVHVAVVAGVGETGGQLPHVHVHPPAVAGAGLGERRGVEAQEGDTGHGAVQHRERARDSVRPRRRRRRAAPAHRHRRPRRPRPTGRRRAGPRPGTTRRSG